MNSQVFLDSLRKALYGKIDDRELSDHMRYYEDYISQEISGGRSEEEILEELGDPRLIARTIAETSGGKVSYKEYTISEDGETEQESEFKVRRLEGWKAKAVMIAGAVLVLLLLILVFQVIVALLPALIVVGAVWWLMKKIRD